MKFDAANRTTKLSGIRGLIQVNPQEPGDASLAVRSLGNVVFEVMTAPGKEIEVNPEMAFPLLAGLASREGLPHVTSEQGNSQKFTNKQCKIYVDGKGKTKKIQELFWSSYVGGCSPIRVVRVPPLLGLGVPCGLDLSVGRVLVKCLWGLQNITSAQKWMRGSKCHRFCW